MIQADKNSLFTQNSALHIDCNNMFPSLPNNTTAPVQSSLMPSVQVSVQTPGQYNISYPHNGNIFLPDQSSNFSPGQCDMIVPFQDNRAALNQNSMMVADQNSMLSQVQNNALVHVQSSRCPQKHGMLFQQNTLNFNPAQNYMLTPAQNSTLSQAQKNQNKMFAHNPKCIGFAGRTNIPCIPPGQNEMLPQQSTVSNMVVPFNHNKLPITQGIATPNYNTNNYVCNPPPQHRPVQTASYNDGNRSIQDNHNNENVNTNYQMNNASYKQQNNPKLSQQQCVVQKENYVAENVLEKGLTD